MALSISQCKPILSAAISVAAVAAATTALSNDVSTNDAVTLSANFHPDPYLIDGIMAGGDVGSRCGTGWIGDDPNLVLDYGAAGYPLTIAAMPSDSSNNLMLQVEQEGGSHETTLHCGDDEFFTINPAVTIEDAASGIYRIWIGVYDQAAGRVPAQVAVSEYLDAARYASGFDLPESATVQIDPVVWKLVAGFNDDPRMLSVVAGGSENAGGDCRFVADGPSLVIDYTPDDFALSFMTLGGAIDTTLMVVDPNGVTQCNDDMTPEDQNAAVTFEIPVTGRYQVYPGTYGAEDVGAFVEIAVTEMMESDVVPAMSSGTGFLVSDHHIVTNAHVVDDTEIVTVTPRGLPPFTARVIARNEDADIALLYADDMPEGLHQVVFRSSPSMQLGEQVFVFGFPLADQLSSGGNLTQGVISAHLGGFDNLTEFQMTAPIQPGSSGSPVFDAAGFLVGMATWTVVDTQQANMAVRGSIVRIFLDANDVDYRHGTLDEERSTSEIGSFVRDVTVRLTVTTDVH